MDMHPHMRSFEHDRDVAFARLDAADVRIDKAFSDLAAAKVPVSLPRALVSAPACPCSLARLQIMLLHGSFCRSQYILWIQNMSYQHTV